MREAVERYFTEKESIEKERALTQDRWQRCELTGEALTHDDIKAWAPDPRFQKHKHSSKKNAVTNDQPRSSSL